MFICGTRVTVAGNAITHKEWDSITEGLTQSYLLSIQSQFSNPPLETLRLVQLVLENQLGFNTVTIPTEIPQKV